MKLVCSLDSLYDVLGRLYNTSESLVFYNKNKDFQIIIRLDEESSTGHYMTFDVLIFINESIEKCLKNYADAADFNNGGLEDEFLVASFEFDKRARDDEKLEEFKDFLNNTENISICPCGERFIHDDKAMCTYCNLTATEEDLKEFECPICTDMCHNFHGVVLKCCGNKIHKKCDESWYFKGNKTCPFCRSALPERQGDLIETLVTTIAEEVERRLNAEIEEVD